MSRLNRHNHWISFPRQNEQLIVIYDNREYTLNNTIGNWFNYERNSVIRLHYDVYVKLYFVSLDPLIIEVIRCEPVASCYNPILMSFI